MAGVVASLPRRVPAAPTDAQGSGWAGWGWAGAQAALDKADVGMISVYDFSEFTMDRGLRTSCMQLFLRLILTFGTRKMEAVRARCRGGAGRGGLARVPAAGVKLALPPPPPARCPRRLPAQICTCACAVCVPHVVWAM